VGEAPPYPSLVALGWPAHAPDGAGLRSLHVEREVNPRAFGRHATANRSESTSTTRSAALPSHSDGTRADPPLWWASATARRIDSRRVPPSRLVPSATVTGRSVLSRNVTQGTPSTVVSS